MFLYLNNTICHKTSKEYTLSCNVSIKRSELNCERTTEEVSILLSSILHDRSCKSQVIVLLLLLLLLFQCLVPPLGHLQVLGVFAPAPVPLRGVGWWWSLAQAYFGHHQTRTHASPAYHVQRQQAAPAQYHAGGQHHIWQNWQL